MTYKLNLLPQAEKELIAVIDRYNERKDGLGFEVYDEIRMYLEDLKTTPLLYQKRYGKLRALFTRRFNFSIYYALEENEIFVYSILHQKEDFNKIFDR